MINTTQVTTENFQEFINANNLALIKISATWCVPCKQIAPMVDLVISEITNEGYDITLGLMDVDSNKDKVVDLGVSSVPALLLYRDGELVEKNVGMISKIKLKEMIKKHIC
jgi:thioredoxin 1